jgi:hypothetical protein
MTNARVVWAAMFASQAVFVLVLALTAPPPRGTGFDSTAIAFVGVQLAIVSAAVLLGRVVLQTVPSGQVLIVRWALGEAASLVGFANAMIGGPFAVTAFGFALSAATFLSNFPGPDVELPRRER